MAPMTRRTLPAALLGAAALSLAACGADSPATAGGPSAKDKQALLDFAACMRDHGVDMPDPKADGGPSLVQAGGSMSPEQERKAEQACKHFQDKIKPPKLTEAQQKEFRDAALANARCMRAHGIDMPDPTFSEDGRATVKIAGHGKGRVGPAPDDPKFRAAAEACKATMPQTKVGP
jgi:hypothetical protein